MTIEYMQLLVSFITSLIIAILAQQTSLEQRHGFKMDQVVWRRGLWHRTWEFNGSKIGLQHDIIWYDTIWSYTIRNNTMRNDMLRLDIMNVCICTHTDRQTYIQAEIQTGIYTVSNIIRNSFLWKCEDSAAYPIFTIFMGRKYEGSMTMPSNGVHLTPLGTGWNCEFIWVSHGFWMKK